MMKLLVIGTGYVGLVSGTCFAEMGHHVICLDTDTKKIEELKKGHIPIYEPSLEEMVVRNLKAGRLEFSSDYASSVSAAAICFLALPTPCLENGHCDLSYIQKALAQMAPHLNEHKIIVNKSTVPVGTGAWTKEFLRSKLIERKQDVPFDIVSNPEFLKEGDAVNDCLKPDRIIIGLDNPKLEPLMRRLYSPFNVSHERLLFMDVASAELTKYAANAMLATRISFMNEIAGLCEKLGADIDTIRKGLGADKRIGYHFLYAGAGYGGSCFPKDIKALKATGNGLNYPMPLLEAVETVNERQKRALGKKIAHYFAHQLKGKTLAIWGLAFKPGTDDMRDASSLILIQELYSKGVNLRLYDPVAMHNAKQLLPFPDIVWCQNEEEAAFESDGIVLMTEWKQFRLVDFPPIIAKMKTKVFFDGRNQYSPKEMQALGFDYFSIGRGPVKAHDPKEELTLLNPVFDGEA